MFPSDEASDGQPGDGRPGALARVVTRLLEADLDSLSDGELSATLIEVERAQAALDAARLRVLADWDRRGAWGHDGATCGGAWLAARSGAAHSTARERIRVAHRTASMPLVREALGQARLSWSKVRLFAAQVPEVAAAAFARDEALLVDQAQALSVQDTKVLLLRWAALADPDGFERAQRQGHRDRRAYCSSTFEGTVALDATLVGEAAAVVPAVLEAIASQLYADEDHPDLLRTAAQRRHDALLEMAKRAAAYDLNHGRRAHPSFTAVIDYERIERCSGIATRTGPPLSAQTAKRLLCEAGVSRLLMGPDSEPLDLGREARLFSHAQRRALIARDKGCAFPDCDRPPGWTSAHHIAEWTRDHGPTDLANGVMLCSTHHTYVHEGGASITREEDGLVFRRPDRTRIQPGWKDLRRAA